MSVRGCINAMYNNHATDVDDNPYMTDGISFQ